LFAAVRHCSDDAHACSGKIARCASEISDRLTSPLFPSGDGVTKKYERAPDDDR
jgi:hypothetical protein